MHKNGRFNLLLLLFVVLCLSFPRLESSHYNVGDHVPFYVNKIGPLNNPSETYHYYDLPFCSPGQVVHKKESLGEILNGDRLTNSLYDLKFRDEKIGEILCHEKLKRHQVAKFRKAIISDFYFQMLYDDLPFWGYIGKVEEESWNPDGKGIKFYLFKHIEFSILYNENQVIEIRAFSDPNHFVDITEDAEVEVSFTYSVFWNKTSTGFDKRMGRYSRVSLLPVQRKIHWFSFINSAVIIVLLLGLLLVFFLQHLKNDLRKLSIGDEEDKEVGWKRIQGDVFRCPPQMPLFCALLGTGTQMLTLVCLLFLLAFLGVLYPYSRGALSTCLVVIHSLTFSVAGFSASSFFGRFAETGWEKTVLLTGILYLAPLYLIAVMLNTASIYYGVTTALPFGTIVVLLLLHTLVSVPLLAIGGAIGYRFKSKYQTPGATKRLAREITITSFTFYRNTPSQMFLGGLLPFSAVVLELHHLYASMWGYKIYTISSILFVTFIILIVLTAILSIGLTYIQLAVEDHKWWWRSVLRGGSTAIFMFGYCIYFYTKSNMGGLLQLLFFFGYNVCLCYALFLILATIAFHASWVFISRIYDVAKSE